MEGKVGIKKNRLVLSAIISTIGMALVISLLIFLFTRPVINAFSLMTGVTPNVNVEGNDADEKFIQSATKISIDIFKQAYSNNNNKNLLVSPLSAFIGFSMTVNGAKGDTLAQVEDVLGNEISIKDINKYFYKYLDNIKKDKNVKLSLPNSLWIKEYIKQNPADTGEGFEVNKDFLQNNADYYGIEVYAKNFAENNAINDINNWMKIQTSNVDKIIDEIDPETMMYLLSTVMFEAEWKQTYNKKDIVKGTFHDETESEIDFMNSYESYYIKDGNAIGFKKLYTGGKYAFVALLPNENISLQDYVQNMTGDGFSKLLKNSANKVIEVNIPKFKTECTVQMTDILKNAGLNDVFDKEKADFTGIGKFESMGNLFVNEVMQKMYFCIDENGTKPGAGTEIKSELDCDVILTFDRPFMYAVIDTETNLPIFMGSVNSLK